MESKPTIENRPSMGMELHSLHQTADHAAGADVENPMIMMQKSTSSDSDKSAKKADPMETSPTILNFENISVSTLGKNSNQLLKNLNGSITGGFWAIMGGSGGGKTTLLSALSLRLDRRKLNVTGSLSLNGREYDIKLLKSMSAYVMQEDILIAELTVQETLMYAAVLRLENKLSKEEKLTRIDEVLDLMGILHIKDVIIGDSRNKGISGGEKRRVSIAIELLLKPKLIFLDEPTSGLDSSTALTVCSCLKTLSIRGECTVVCTIHQPQQKLFELFDNLILMKKGKIVYQGSIEKSLLFLESIGMPCNDRTNPADALIESVTMSTRDSSIVEMVEDSASQTIPVNLSLGFDKGAFSIQNTRSWFSQYTTLCRRNFHQYWRRKDIIVLNICGTLFLGFILGFGLWFEMGKNLHQTEIAKITPSLFCCVVSQGITASLQTVFALPKERAIMLRERAAGSYFVSAYYMAKVTMDMLVINLISPTLFSIVVYFLVGYQNTAGKFFTFWIFMVFCTYAATAVATALSCIFVTIELSTVVLSAYLEGCAEFMGAS